MALREYLLKTVEQTRLSRTDSVVEWLGHVRLNAETECMSVLQGKSLGREQTSHSDFHRISKIKDDVTAVLDQVESVAEEKEKILQKVEKSRWNQVYNSSIKMTCHIRSILQEYSNRMIVIVGCAERQRLVMEESAKLIQYLESHREDSNGMRPSRAAVIEQVHFLHQGFEALLELLVKHMTSGLLELLQDTKNHLLARRVIESFMELGLKSDLVCSAVVKNGGMMIFLQTCDNARMVSVHKILLRTIAVFSALPDSIDELDRCLGIEKLCEILGDPKTAEEVKAEAAGVIAQVTSPNIEYRPLAGLLENLPEFTTALTNLCAIATSCEVFLLGCAALANITFTDSMACELLSQQGTCHVLLQAKPQVQTIFSKDQMATVLGNMCANEMCILDVVTEGGIQVLVQYLKIRQRECTSHPEMAACEQMHQKSAVALARLARNRLYARNIVDAGGLPPLIELSLDTKARNYSDAVHLSCLAALRKVAVVCTDDELKKMPELVHLTVPLLADAFSYCNSQLGTYI